MDAWQKLKTFIYRSLFLNKDFIFDKISVLVFSAFTNAIPSYMYCEAIKHLLVLLFTENISTIFDVIYYKTIFWSNKYLKNLKYIFCIFHYCDWSGYICEGVKLYTCTGIYFYKIIFLKRFCYQDFSSCLTFCL